MILESISVIIIVIRTEYNCDPYIILQIWIIKEILRILKYLTNHFNIWKNYKCKYKPINDAT
jgi:hypothetical protein